MQKKLIEYGEAFEAWAGRIFDILDRPSVIAVIALGAILGILMLEQLTKGARP
jgi:hypothetical protein